MDIYYSIYVTYVIKHIKAYMHMVYMYVCIYIYMYVCMYVYIHICM